ncbi:LRP16 family protein [Trichophaea hybrida]|nr:LRP16 family protein [Trichophaea hybrida]
MAPIQQAQIPTLALLYATKRLVPSAGQPLYAASNTFNTTVGLIRTDITTLELKNGAIVNAANKRLLGGGGVDGAIHRAAGFGLLNECRTLGGAQTGESKITNAYNLPCKAVIHTVGPVYSMEEKAQELLTSCYESSLKLAVEAGLNAIAFSAVSTGIYGYPSAKAARTALKTVRKFLETDDGKKLDLVVFCNFEKKDEDAYHELIP